MRTSSRTSTTLRTVPGRPTRSSRPPRRGAKIGAKYSNKAFLGLKHTEVQLQQNQYKVGLYPSGSWLENEQAKDTPAGFEYAVMPDPERHRLGQAAGDRDLRRRGRAVLRGQQGQEPPRRHGVPAAHAVQAGAKGFTELTKVLTVVKGATEGDRSSPRPDQQQRHADQGGGRDNFSFRFDTWYKKLDDEARAATNELMSPVATPTSSVTGCRRSPTRSRRTPPSRSSRADNRRDHERSVAFHETRQVPVHHRLPGRAGGALRDVRGRGVHPGLPAVVHQLAGLLARTSSTSASSNFRSCSGRHVLAGGPAPRRPAARPAAGHHRDRAVLRLPAQRGGRPKAASPGVSGGRSSTGWCSSSPSSSPWPSSPSSSSGSTRRTTAA